MAFEGSLEYFVSFLVPTGTNRVTYIRAKGLLGKLPSFFNGKVACFWLVLFTILAGRKDDVMTLFVSDILDKAWLEMRRYIGKSHASV